MQRLEVSFSSRAMAPARTWRSASANGGLRALVLSALGDSTSDWSTRREMAMSNYYAAEKFVEGVRRDAERAAREYPLRKAARDAQGPGLLGIPAAVWRHLRPGHSQASSGQASAQTRGRSGGASAARGTEAGR